MIGKTMTQVNTPALLLDLDLLEHNITTMAALAAGTGLMLRPHVKTHKSPLIALAQVAAGAVGVCCAKVSEAEVMVNGGGADVHVTTPAGTPEKIGRLMALARRATASVVADDAGNLRLLSEAA